MRPRTLIGLMLCTLFISAPAVAQTTETQPVIQTAQAVRNDITIPEGTTQVFDAATGEIKFDGVLTNKGTIIIRSSNPAQAEAVLRAVKVFNQGKIVSEVPTLTINTQVLGGTGDYTASETISVVNDSRLEIRAGRFYSEWFRPKTKGWLIINANRIDGKVDLAASEVSIGVREGHLNIVNQKLDGDPLIYNTGGDVTSAIPPSGGHDIMILAAGDVIVGSLDATGSSTPTEGKIAIRTGLRFTNPGGGDVILPCGTSSGGSEVHDCNDLVNQLSQPGQPLDGPPGNFPLAGKIVISGDVKAKDIHMISREIEINGNLRAVRDASPAQASVSLLASKSITVTGTIKADSDPANPNYGSVYLESPIITVNGKITTDAVNLNASETLASETVATTGSITTGAIEAGTYISINAGRIQFGEVGGALLPSVLPHDSGEFTIKTGKLTAHRAIILAATGNIDAGNIDLLPNEAAVPGGEHDVRIHANVGKEDAQPLKIGGGTNGAASITVHGTTDLGPGLTQKTGTIFLTNGPSGDIVIDGAKLHVTSEHDGTPSLVASAGTGQVTVTGSIVLDGTATAPAGQILLVGDEIRSTGATISAKDTLADPADKPAKVILATSKLTLAGDLAIEANSKAVSSVRIVPKGSIVIDPQEHSVQLYVDKFPVNVTDEEVLVGGAGNLVFKANSNGGKILFTAKTLTFANAGSTDLISNGEQTLIKLDRTTSENSGQNSLIFTGGPVTLNTDSETSDGGEINLLADGIRSDGGADLNLFSRAQGTGNGGVIIVSAQKINLDESTVNHVDASALSSGDGGHITVQSLGRFDLGSIAFDANGIGSGAGGRVDLLNERELDFEVTQIEINAKGGNTGFGGVAGIGNIPASDFLSFIHVEGGQSINAGDFDGAIGLNTCSGVTSCAVAVAVKSTVSSALPDGVENFCKRIRTGNDFWPDHYWNCAPTAQASSKDDVAAAVASGNKFSDLRNTLNQSEILVWKNGADFKHAWKDTTTSTLSGGLTFRLGETIYVNPWQRGSIGSKTTAVNYSKDQYVEVSAHELGHAVDIALGGPGSGTKPSDLPNWTSHLTKDELEMNMVFDASQNLIRRLPCDVTPLGNGATTVTYPLKDVKDATTGVDVCVNGLVNDALLAAGSTWNQNTVTASQVMRHIEAGLFVNNAEPHAQAFGWATVGTKGARPMMDKVFDNGFYRCLNRFAVAEQNGAAPIDACPFFIQTH